MQVLSNSRRLSRVLKSSTLLSSNHPVFTSSSTCPRHHWQLRSTFFSPSLFSDTKFCRDDPRKLFGSASTANIFYDEIKCLVFVSDE
ncbi:hypothetical protein CISIN_1g033408mg [Citrus sinensis]|uniref:Uncharacterized protein n=1 Tax=Citrus sinensis TaxID=2711 RepID=A0A067G956_CITSI|nr:hypothetical protein CISIN_1g033408mg [Citrus sinensis]